MTFGRRHCHCSFSGRLSTQCCHRQSPRRIRKLPRPPPPSDHLCLGKRPEKVHCTELLHTLYNAKTLKGLSHEIFGPVYWPVWMHLGLNKNRFRFFNFKDALSIWDSHFKFWCVSVQTFSEILRISEKDWQLSPQFSKIYLNCQLLSDTLML